MRIIYNKVKFVNKGAVISLIILDHIKYDIQMYVFVRYIMVNRNVYLCTVHNYLCKKKRKNKYIYNIIYINKHTYCIAHTLYIIAFNILISFIIITY